MILLLFLFILTGALGIWSYFIFNKRLLSPTIISCIFFGGFELIYIMFFDYIDYEISLKTVCIILASLFFTMIGEYIARCFSLKKRKSNQKTSDLFYIKTPKYWTYFISFGALVIALYRFYDLYKFSLSIGNSMGILGTLSSTRLAYAQGEYTGGNLFISLSTIAIEILCYVYVYIFLHNLMLIKKVVWRNVLPIIGYCLIVVSFTNRTEYLKIGFSFIIVLLYLMYTYPNIIHIKRKILGKAAKFGVILLVLFFAYGNLTREDLEESTLKEEIVAYSSAAIIGLDSYLENPWSENPYFGYYTFQNVYDFLGVDHEYKPQHNLRFFTYNDKGSSSNIYTSLVLPIQDYGIFFMLISRSILSFVCTKILNLTLKMRLSKKLFLMMAYSSLIGYMYICVPIADRFYNYFLSPETIIKYTIYAYGVLIIFCRYKLINCKK